LSLSSSYLILFVLALMVAVTSALIKAQAATAPWRWRYALLLAFAIGALPLAVFLMTLFDIQNYIAQVAINSDEYLPEERDSIGLALTWWWKYVLGGLILLALGTLLSSLYIS